MPFLVFLFGLSIALRRQRHLIPARRSLLLCKPRGRDARRVEFERRPRPRRFPAFWPRRNNHGSILRGNLGCAVAVCSRGHSALVRDPVGIEKAIYAMLQPEIL